MKGIWRTYGGACEPGLLLTAGGGGGGGGWGWGGGGGGRGRGPRPARAAGTRAAGRVHLLKEGSAQWPSFQRSALPGLEKKSSRKQNKSSTDEAVLAAGSYFYTGPSTRDGRGGGRG